jgi:hypothetical protein
VRQHAHGRMVLAVREAVHAVPEAHSPCMRSSGSGYFRDARKPAARGRLREGAACLVARAQVIRQK